MSQFRRPASTLHTFLRLTRALPDRFQRSRVWCPRSTMAWLLLICSPDRRTSYRSSLRRITCYGRRYFGWVRQPSLASISKARRNLKRLMLREFLHEVVTVCEQIMPTPKHSWGKRRFIAFDGSRFVTPRTADTARKLHRFHKPDGDRVHNPQGLLVAAVDVMRRLPLDWTFVGKGVGERTAMTELVDRLPWQDDDVAIMDRGFPSKKLIGVLIERGIDVVARMSTSDSGSWKELKPFLKGKAKTATIDLTLQGSEAPITVTVRLVERDRKRGRPRKGTKPERMVILTTLKPEDGFDRDAVIKLYAARWGIESLFGEMKSFMDVESFHSGFVDGCEQEIVAAMIWMALGSFLQAEAERTLDGKRVVRADCLRAAADLVADLMQGRRIGHRYDGEIESLRRYAFTPKSDRHYPRECKRPHGRSIQRGRAK